MKWIQVVSDALIPILGYFLWGWGLFFILLYYLIDLMVSELFMYIKTRAILLKQGGNVYQAIMYILIGQVLLVSTLLLIRIFMLNVHPELNLKQEIITFWKYKDLGIQQGYILLPLVFFVGFQRYKWDFLNARKNETQSVVFLWRDHLKRLLLLLTCVGFMAGLTSFVIFPDWVYLSLLLGTTSIFQFVY
jgi:hypothetical protein